MKKLLVMEFNELCPDLMSRFIAEGHLPNFKRLREISLARETETDATGEDLNPWVQWMDLHTGLERQEHGLTKLNEVMQFKGKYTWDIISEQFGGKNWICGSMNAGYGEQFKGRFLPDPWCTDVAPKPESDLQVFYDYVSQAVQSHSKKAPVSNLSFVKSLMKQGIGFTTLLRLAKQIVSEKITGKGNWKRAMLLDQVQYDIFKYHYQKEQPNYSTFFSNAAAHYQHHYWRDFEPEKFTNLDGEINEETKNAILLAYKNNDNIVGKLMKLVGHDTALIFTTALSQQPYVESERFYYHIEGAKQFFNSFNIPSNAKYKPVMAEQFRLACESEEAAISVAAELDKYHMDSDEYFHVGSDRLFLVSREENDVFVQCRCTKDVSQNASFYHSDDKTVTFNFYQHFYKMNEVKTGCHNPVGLYWSKNLQLAEEQEQRVKPSQVHHDIIGYFAS